MSQACAQPISWLLLERHALGELAGQEVSTHLSDCASCRAALDVIERDRGREMPSLPDLTLARASRRRRRLRAAVAGGAVALAAAAMLSIMWRGRDDRIAGIKGGELTVSVVRERDGEVEHEPDDFLPGDRFKVLVTCAAAEPVTAHVTVRQAGTIARPLPPASIECGNRVTLPGAFRLTGSEPASICVEIGGVEECVFLTAP